MYKIIQLTIRWALIVAVFASFTLFNCRKNEGKISVSQKTVGIPKVPVSGILFNKATLSLNASDTETLKATISPANATNKQLKWRSDTEGVATVSRAGLVTGVSIGSAIITTQSVSDRTKKATCVVRVTKNTQPLESTVSIPTGGNSWVLYDGEYANDKMVTKQGIRRWVSPKATIRTFFYLREAGKISIGMKAKVSSGTSKIRVSLNNERKEVQLSNNDFQDVYVGDFDIKHSGYHFIDLVGLEKDASTYAEVNDILLGESSPEGVHYIKKPNFHFGRRGPSTHLNFPIPPQLTNVAWFYSELLIPEGQDVIGSYFMANGFAEGYFGIQVNTDTERRINFSVWSPYQTDDPSQVPEEDKIKLLKKGKDVIIHEFGNEGSGGQSYKRYYWKAGIAYQFLIGAKPSINNSTDYTAYFYDPEKGNWDLIAQFRRPKTTTYLKRIYSFLENFIPSQGVFSRRGLYSNQWIYASGQWHSIQTASFTADDTARREDRLDYSGGVEQQGFYMQMGGFTHEHTPIGTTFRLNRRQDLQPPRIDFNTLE